MFEDYTPEVIRDNIIENTGTGVSTQEGSFTSDMAAPVALQISNAYGQLDKLLKIMFLDTNETVYLEKRASELGITRKPGSYASGTVTVTGTDGSKLPSGAAVVTSDGLVFYLEDDITVKDGTGTSSITAAETGVAYNVEAGAIVQLYRSYAGITGVTNTACTGGVDPETDDALKERVFLRLQTPTTSGNANHYKTWALECTGVGGAKVIPLWNGNGTVKVLIVGSDHKPVTSDIVSACEAYIETQRPIGATVTVESAEARTIAVSASVSFSGTTIEKVTAAFEEALQSYINSIAFKSYTVSYNRIAYALMSVDGVTDYKDLLVNGGTANIALYSTEVPVKGEVTLSAV